MNGFTCLLLAYWLLGSILNRAAWSPVERVK